MPLYAMLCTIDTGKLELFSRLRAEHFAFLLDQQQRIRFGGPARLAEGGPPETMIIIAEAPSLAQAEAFIAAEPYNRAGGFSAVRVRPWSQVLPEPEPGALQRIHAAEMQTRQE